MGKEPPVKTTGRWSPRAGRPLRYCAWIRSRQVCVTASEYKSEKNDGVTFMMEILRNYFAPAAAGPINQEVVRFTQYRQTDHTIGKYIAELDMLRPNADSEIGGAVGFPEHVISSLRLQNAGLSRQEKSLALASSQKSLTFMGVAASMRRLFGSRGGAIRQNVLITQDVEGPFGRESDQGARATYKKAKKQGVGQKRRDGFPNVSGGEAYGGRPDHEWVQSPYWAAKSALYVRQRMPRSAEIPMA